MKAIIIGNGKSLKTHLKLGHFDMLAGIDTFAMNRIDMIYNKTKWRPANWFFVENKTKAGTPIEEELGMFLKVYKRHIEPGVERCFVNPRFKAMFPEEIATAENVTWITRCNEHDYTNPPKTWHVPKYCIYGGTINTALMHIYNDCSGYDDIGVMGCDLGMCGTDDHFDPDYPGNIEPSVDWDTHNNVLREVHRMAYDRFKATGRRVVNIGICGDLDVYPRMKFEKWIEDNYVSDG